MARRRETKEEKKNLWIEITINWRPASAISAHKESPTMPWYDWQQSVRISGHTQPIALHTIQLISSFECYFRRFWSNLFSL